jgi:hypothetical protein
MNVLIPYNAGNYRVAAQLVTSAVVLSSTELVRTLQIEAILLAKYYQNKRRYNLKLVAGFNSGLSLPTHEAI